MTLLRRYQLDYNVPCSGRCSDQWPIYDQLLYPTTDRTINRDGRRPIVRSIVASCDRTYEQSCILHVTDRTSTRGVLWPSVRSIVAPDCRSYDSTINRSIVRPIVATYDRSYGQSWQSWRQTTDRSINRSIVRPIVRSIVRIPIRDHPQLVVPPCTTGGTIT